MSIEATLNRLAAFVNSPGLNSEAVLELEHYAREAAQQPALVNEDVMCQCAELLETIPIASTAARALIMFLANACVSDSNRSSAVRYGIPSTCVLLLQRFSELSDETLYQILDLMTTLAAASGEGRRCLRPAIPHIIACMNTHQAVTSLDILFAGSCALSTLAMLDSSNAELIASRGGLQTLISSFRLAIAEKQQTSPTTTTSTTGARSRGSEALQEKIELCDAVIKWCRDAAVKVIRCPSPCVDPALQALDFGLYGHTIDVDQLQWDLKFERKKVSKNIPTVKPTPETKVQS